MSKKPAESALFVKFHRAHGYLAWSKSTMVYLKGVQSKDVPPALVLFGTVLPKIGRLLGKRNERSIVEHLQNTLAARIEIPEP